MESSGTIIYIQWSQDEIVLVADSREVVGNSYSDVACKIAAPGGQLVFAASGRLARTGNKDVAWDAYAIASEEFIRLTREGTPDDFAMKLAEAWGGAVKIKLEESGPEVFIGVTNPMSSGFFADFEKAGALSIVVEEITYETNANGHHTIIASPKRISSEPGGYYLGHGEIINEIFARQTDRSKQWANEVRRAMDKSNDPLVTGGIEIVQLTIDNLPKTQITAGGIPFSYVGPPIATVRMKHGKPAEWIQQGKCPTQ